MKTTVIVLLFTALLVAQTSKPKPSSTHSQTKTYTCSPGPDEQCASDLWYADYLKLRELQKKYTPPQDLADQMTGITVRLNQQIPAGYRWDETKQRFVKNAPSQPAAPSEKK